MLLLLQCPAVGFQTRGRILQSEAAYQPYVDYTGDNVRPFNADASVGRTKSMAMRSQQSVPQASDLTTSSKLKPSCVPFDCAPFLRSSVKTQKIEK